MRLSIKIQIEGEFYIQNKVSINIEQQSKTVTLLHESNKSFLIISKKVIDYDKIMPTLDGKQIRLTPSESYQDLIDIVKYIEAIGTEFMLLQKVYWEEYDIIWTPDVPEEDHIYPIYSYKSSISNHPSPKIITIQTLRHIFNERKRYEVLSIPFSFYRLGNRFFHNMDFRMAFMQHYLMLDYCFSNNQFETQKVIKAFQSNRLLRYGAYRFLQHFFVHANKNDIAFYNKQMKAFNQYNVYKKDRKYNSHIDFLLAMLVELRGKVFHATKHTTNYITEEEFSSLSRITWEVCSIVAGLLRTELFCTKNERDKLWTFEENSMRIKE